MSQALLTIISANIHKNDPRALVIKSSALVAERYRIQGTLATGLTLTPAVNGNKVNQATRKSRNNVRFMMPPGGPQGLAVAEVIPGIGDKGQITIPSVPLAAWSPRRKYVRRRRPAKTAAAPTLPGLEESKPNGPL